jgi:sugar-phosphatase
MIQAIIFDMDGLLVDSEPVWQKAEIEIFKKVNITLTREMCMQTMGLRIDEVVNHWHSKYPWDHITRADLQEEIIQTVIKYIQTDAGPMDGVNYLLEFFKAKGFKLALASSSHFAIINAVVKKLNIAHYFNKLHSAEVEAYGKPHPAIYLHTAEALGIAPTQCVAFEDSFNGLIAARAARMKAVAIPDPSHFHDTRFDIAHLKLKSLSDFREEHLDLLNKATT